MWSWVHACEPSGPGGYAYLCAYPWFADALGFYACACVLFCGAYGACVRVGIYVPGSAFGTCSMRQSQNNCPTTRFRTECGSVNVSVSTTGCRKRRART